MFKMFKALKEMRKQGGMLFCKSCLEKKINERTNDPAAVKKSLASGYYKPAPEDKKCYLCNAKADYLVSVGDAMSAVQKVSRSRI